MSRLQTQKCRLPDKSLSHLRTGMADLLYFQKQKSGESIALSRADQPSATDSTLIRSAVTIREVTGMGTESVWMHAGRNPSACAEAHSGVSATAMDYLREKLCYFYPEAEVLSDLSMPQDALYVIFPEVRAAALIEAWSEKSSAREHASTQDADRLCLSHKRRVKDVDSPGAGCISIAGDSDVYDVDYFLDRLPSALNAIGYEPEWTEAA